MRDEHRLCTTDQDRASVAPLQGHPDEELVAKIAAKDERALREIIARHSVAVASLSRRICFDESEVDCVVSEVFWELWCRAAAFDVRRAKLRTFLLTIARSRCIDRRRAALSRERAHQALADTDAGQMKGDVGKWQPGEQVLCDERDSLIRSAMDDLPAAQRQPIELAFFDGLTHEQVAMRLNSPLGTVKTRIRSGLKHLRELLAEYGKPENCQ